MLIHDLLRASAEIRPEAVLLRHLDASTTYGEILTAAGAFATFLAGNGLAPGDRVALLLPNSRAYVEAYYGVLQAGGIAVPLHPGTDAPTAARLLAHCQARVLVTGAASESVAAIIEKGPPALESVILAEGDRPPLDASTTITFHRWPAPDGAPPAPRPALRDTDRAMIIYTSGSTGHPRGAVLSHRNIIANTRDIVSYLELSREDRVSVVLPFPYVYGKSLLNTHVATGGSLVLHDNLLFPNTVLDTMEREQVTGFSGVPSTFAILLSRSDLASRRLPALRYVTQAGGKMAVPLIRQLMAALPATRIFIMYGATEAAARLTYLAPDDLSGKIGSVGKPLAGVEMKILDDSGAVAATGNTGEIVAAGENIMEGYWGDAEATTEVLDAHGFHTGDLGRQDEDGYFWVVGRTREMIKSGAHRISPLEIEEALLGHDAVEEAAVVGAPDPTLGEAIVAHVVLQPGAELDADGLLLFCRSHLARHKLPRRVHFRRSLPRKPSGKVDKLSLAREETPD